MHAAENVQASTDGQAILAQLSTIWERPCVIRKVLQEASKARELVQQLKVWTGDPCAPGSASNND
jgi:hypothetical protein